MEARRRPTTHSTIPFLYGVMTSLCEPAKSLVSAADAIPLVLV